MSSSTVTPLRSTAGDRARDRRGLTAGAGATARWHGTATTQPRRAVHLTRRGRLLVVLGAAGLLLAAFAVGRSGGQAVAAPQPLPGVAAVAEPVPDRTTVQAGDTLWAIAQRIAPGRDPRDVVQQLRRLNELPSGGLQAGQQLLLPVAA